MILGWLFRYTRNLVDEGNGKYNLMALCWGEGHGSAIHDHANSHCFMKMLQGSLEEIRFAWPEKTDEELKEIGRKRLNVNEVTYMNGKSLSLVGYIKENNDWLPHVDETSNEI